MGLFNRNDMDDFDDYKKEQRQIERERELNSKYNIDNEDSSKPKSKNFYKRKITLMEELPDGSLLFKNNIYWKDKYFLTVFLMIPFIFILITFRMNASGFGDTEVFYPIIFSALFFGVLIALTAAKGKKNKSFKITKDSVEINQSKTKTLVFPIQDYMGLECKRTYGKNHHYTGTIYYALFKDGAATRRFRFSSSVPEVASNFDYHVRKRQNLAKSGETEVNFNNGITSNLPSRIFEWPQKLVKINKTERNSLLFVGIAMIIMFGTIFTATLSTSNQGLNTDMFPIFLVCVFVIIFSCLIVFSGGASKPVIYPEIMSFEVGGVRINDAYFRANEIKRVYITPVGSDNPSVTRATTLYLDVGNGLYRYKITSLFNRFSSDREIESMSPNWEYSAFYTYLYNWCKENNVEFIDYIL